MNEMRDIEIILGNIIELLDCSGENDWGVLISKIRVDIKNDPKSALREIMRLYAGMGSFNDLILYKAGIPLKSENDKLSNLRERLFALCKRNI